jgi:hypothetical protein
MSALYAGPAVVVYDGGFHGVHLELDLDDTGPLLDWGGIARITDPLIGRWGATIGQQVHVILPGLLIGKAIVADFAYDGAGTARSRLVGNGPPPARP